MQLHPTRATFHVAVAGAGLVALGAAARLPPVVAFGGAMLLAVAAGRAVALLAVTRLRAAGFEMVWSAPAHAYRTTRGARLAIEGELRNRGSAAVRGVALRALASSMLECTIEPETVDLPAGGRCRVDLTVTGRRIGRWGVHGVALEVRGTPLGGEGLYEVPLLFANPLGIEVLPASLSALIRSARGGRARQAMEAGRPGALAGGGDELRELRDHVPGDPFKRIAWKASARRGRLLVREMERDERSVVWLVVDGSVELWAGALGDAPLDHVVEEVAAVATRLLRRGERVGLAVSASRVRTWITPAGGAAQGAILAGALASAASCIDADRSELDERRVAQRVYEHARPLDPRGLEDVKTRDLDALAKRAEVLRRRAPFAPRLPFAPTEREQILRHYLAAFGIESPPRADGERPRSDATLLRVLERLAVEKPRPSLVHVWAPVPSDPATLGKATRALRRHHIDLRWTLPPLARGLGGEDARRGPVADVADDAVTERARVTERRAVEALRRLGVRAQSALLRPRAEPIEHAPEVPPDPDRRPEGRTPEVPPEAGRRPEGRT